MTFPDRHIVPDAIAASYPVLVTKTDHGLVDYQRVIATQFIRIPEPDATGMEQLNNREFVVNVIDANTFTLYDVYGNAVDGTNFTPFVANGLGKFTLTGPDLFVENEA